MLFRSDHAGNLELFPNARFHLQDAEMEFVTGRAMTHAAMRHSFRLDDVLEMVTLVYGDRVVFHAGDEDIAPGIAVHHVPGHTRGLQSVSVNTARGRVVLDRDRVVEVLRVRRVDGHEGKIAKVGSTLEVLAAGGHGTAMLEANPELAGRIIAWLEAALG